MANIVPRREWRTFGSTRDAAGRRAIVGLQPRRAELILACATASSPSASAAREPRLLQAD